MGANLQRWVMAPPNPEPALVQTGNEPDAPNFWCGRNLLTAFVSWGADTCFDGIVISQSCARRLNTPYPAEPGDKLGNRHGTTGVVSRVLPDDEMPHLPDGTPVELVFNFSGMHVRMNFGQVREAVMSRIARVEGQPMVVPPFGAPGQDELRQRLAQAGLPESGMETLTLGRNGPPLERPSTVGWVYWFQMAHWLAKLKIQTPPDTLQMQREFDYNALRELEAYENLREYINTRAARREDAQAFASRVAAGPVEQAGPPSPLFADLARRLRVTGIEVVLESDKLTFRFQSPQGNGLKLARPVKHPWLHERPLSEIGSLDEMEANDAQDLYRPDMWMDPNPPALPREEYKLLVEANDRLARMVSSRAPERLVRDATVQLEHRVNALFDALLTPAHLRFSETQLASARAVIAPGADLRFDQIGLADEIAWALFAPLIIHEMGGDTDAVQARSKRAAQALDEVMARSWVLVNHASPYTPSRSLAFRPVRDPDHVIRLHPLACGLLDADFDGDQVHVLLPVTAGAQREAGERLSLAGYLARDPELIQSLLLPPEALWGLASLSLTERGRREIGQMAGIEVATPSGVITQATLAQAMRQVLERDGAGVVLSAMERLMRRGFQIVKASGASMSPFLGASLRLPPAPEQDAPERWDAYLEELSEKVLSGADYADADLGPQLLAVHIRARGRFHLPRLIGPRGAATDIQGKPLIVRHTHVEGLTPEELYACSVSTRKALRAHWDQIEQMASDRGESNRFTVLARARQAQHPGIVFARAAAIGEVDPLTDVDSRLLVGLPVNQS